MPNMLNSQSAIDSLLSTVERIAVHDTRWNDDISRSFENYSNDSKRNVQNIMENMEKINSSCIKIEALNVYGIISDADDLIKKVISFPSFDKYGGCHEL